MIAAIYARKSNEERRELMAKVVTRLCASLLVGAACFAPLSAHAVTAKQWQEWPAGMRMSYVAGLVDGWRAVINFLRMVRPGPGEAPAPANDAFLYPGRHVDCLVARQMSPSEVSTIVEQYVRHQGARWPGATEMTVLVSGALTEACGLLLEWNEEAGSSCSHPATVAVVIDLHTKRSA